MEEDNSVELAEAKAELEAAMAKVKVAEAKARAQVTLGIVARAWSSRHCYLAIGVYALF